LTQSLTEISIRNIFWGGRGGREGKSSQFVGPVYQSGSHTLLEPSGTAIGQHRDCFIELTVSNMPAGMQFVWKYFSFTFTVHLAYSYTHL
jgi:hypothetical protein